MILLNYGLIGTQTVKGSHAIGHEENINGGAMVGGGGGWCVLTEAHELQDETGVGAITQGLTHSNIVWCLAEWRERTRHYAGISLFCMQLKSWYLLQPITNLSFVCFYLSKFHTKQDFCLQISYPAILFTMLMGFLNCESFIIDALLPGAHIHIFLPGTLQCLHWYWRHLYDVYYSLSMCVCMYFRQDNALPPFSFKLLYSQLTGQELET